MVKSNKDSVYINYFSDKSTWTWLKKERTEDIVKYEEALGRLSVIPPKIKEEVPVPVFTREHNDSDQW
jgi:hypothetical protein